MPCSEGSVKRAVRSNMREKHLTAQHENTIALQRLEKQKGMAYSVNGVALEMPFLNWVWNSPNCFLL